MSLDPKVAHEMRMKACRPSLRKGPDEPLIPWQAKTRAELEHMLGLPIAGGEDHFRVEWTREEAAFTETRFLFASEPDCDAVCHLLMPKTASEGRIPLVICLQGHSTGMHISLGRPKYEHDQETISGGDRDFACQIVARGQAALTLEQRAFGERGGTPKGPDCLFPAMQALLIGRTLLGERCHDVSRAIDVVTAHFPAIDPARIAVMGNSGGGTTSLYAAALDTRIAACMPSCAFSGFVESIGLQHHCACNYVPGILNKLDMGDIAGLIAPRPLVIVNGLHDGIFPIDAARAQADITRSLYEQAGAAGAFRHVVGQEGHRFYADLGWAAFDQVTGWKD